MAIATYNDDELDWIDQVFERAKKLIHNKIWEGINDNALKDWRGCLQNLDAELLGAYLLDNLTYRSRDQFSSLLDSLFTQVERQFKVHGNRFDLAALRVTPNKSPSVLLAPVIGLESPPTKSGPYILRLVQRRYQIRHDYLAWPARIMTGTTAGMVIFIDDFCGTGTQFCEFSVSIGLDAFHKAHPECTIVYCVATAHEKGIQHIKKELPFVHLITADRLGDNHAILSDACFGRYNIEGFKDKVLAQYKHVLSKAELPVKGRLSDGYGKLELAYAFAHATPNNTLPIFWYDTIHWTPLLDR